MKVEVGDVLAGSWGYSMRLYSFVRVERVTPKQVVLRELKNESLGGPQWDEIVKPTSEIDPRGRTFRVKNDKPDYIWNPTFKCLYRPYEPDAKYTENHMD